MALTDEQIRERLSPFAAKWSVWDRSERAGAQSFLTELFACYGQTLLEVAHFEEPQEGRFVDLIWPRVCIFEMKAPGEAAKLLKHRSQALGYWEQAAKHAENVESPRYVVLCAFKTLEVWEPGKFPGQPRAVLDLVELEQQYATLLFLAGRQPVFVGGQEAVTREAVGKITDLHHRLSDRLAASPDVLREFVLQSVWCMFAEDLGQLPSHRFTVIVDELLAGSHRSSEEDLGRLFDWLNDPAKQRPTHGLYYGVPYANGSLFAEPAHVHLEPDELQLLRQACGFNWRDVQPQIFGSLLEGALGHEKQWHLGAHYTHEPDIQKVIQPSIVEPWRERIENVETHSEAVAAQTDLMGYTVLDPACGSGNFLYVAYQELRRLEQRLRTREEELAVAEGKPAQSALSGLFFPLHNLRGIELDAFAAALARVTLWMGHKLAVERLKLSESTLPLVDLSGIRVGDALKLPWPKADVIVGNPPFHGSQNLREELGDDYVGWLGKEFGVGLKDYCVYWFRRAHDHLEPGHRAGLVGTNSISQNRARGASLNYIAENDGVITSAVSKQKWPGDAVVNVSIVNWVNEPAEAPERFVLDGEEVVGVSTRLVESPLAIEEFDPLPENRGRAFQGPIPGGDFYLNADEAAGFLALPDASYREVVRPYLVGDDVTDDPAQAPRRWVIDFGSRPLEEAMRYPAALKRVRERVKPERDRNRRKVRREKWWLFAERAVGLKAAVEHTARYIAGNRIGKRFLFTWQPVEVCPSDLVIVFALDTDYAMGVLTSSVHRAWAMHQSSTLRVDLRYTPTTAFEPFPWPQPEAAAREAIGALADRIIDRRQEICAEREFGLTALYNAVDDGAWTDLRMQHEELDRAVAAAYGWPVAVADQPIEVVRRLAELHTKIVAGDVAYEPFA